MFALAKCVLSVRVYQYVCVFYAHVGIKVLYSVLSNKYFFPSFALFVVVVQSPLLKQVSPSFFCFFTQNLYFTFVKFVCNFITCFFDRVLVR